MPQDARRPPRPPRGRAATATTPAAAKSTSSAAKAEPTAAKTTPANARAAAATAKPAATKRKPATTASATKATADRAGWLSGIRFSGFSLIMMGVLVLAVVVLAPTIAAFAAQRQQIAELRATVSAHEAEVQRLHDERERWNDETFIMTQARERLYYVLPGEVSYLVIDDRTEAAKADATTEVSAEVTESKGDWMRTLLDSVMVAGLTPSSTAPESTAPESTAPADGSDG